MGCTASIPKENPIAKTTKATVKDIEPMAKPKSPDSTKEEVSPVPKDQSGLRMKTFFILGERIKEDESITVEYKEYHYPFRRKLRATLRNTICAFLNRRGGRIYIGIDDNKSVKGIHLTYKQRDSLRLEIQDMLREFEPPINNDERIKVVEIPVKYSHNNEIFPGCFVIKIIVKQGNPSKLYSVSTFPFETYIRNEGQTQSVPASQITEYIVQRHQNPGHKVPDEEFMDPPPEEIKDIFDEKKSSPSPNKNNDQPKQKNSSSKQKGFQGNGMKVYIPRKDTSPNKENDQNHEQGPIKGNHVQLNIQKETSPQQYNNKNHQTSGQSYSQSPPTNNQKQRKALIPGAYPGQKVHVIFLQGLPPTMMEFKLKAIINQMNLSSLISMKLFFFKNGPCNGRAYVNFGDQEEAKLAYIGLNNKDIEGAIVKAELSVKEA